MFTPVCGHRNGSDGSFEQEVFHEEATAGAVSSSAMARRQRSACEVLRDSNRRSQHASHKNQRTLREGGLVGRMSCKGDGWDNAVVERFFATLTKQLLDDVQFESRHAARRAIGDFIGVWYTHERPHSSRDF